VYANKNFSTSEPSTSSHRESTLLLMKYEWFYGYGRPVDLLFLLSARTHYDDCTIDCTYIESIWIKLYDILLHKSPRLCLLVLVLSSTFQKSRGRSLGRQLICGWREGMTCMMYLSPLPVPGSAQFHISKLHIQY
jgi:hypothetical protein